MGASPPPPPDDRTGYSTEQHPPPRADAGESWQVPAGAYDPAAPPAGGGTNGVAVGALVCGILALVCGIGGMFIITVPLAVILGIVGIVLGVMGTRRARVSGVGRGQAIGGIVTGALGLVASVLWVMLLVAGWSTMVDQFGDPIQDPEGFEERLEEFDDEQQP